MAEILDWEIEMRGGATSKFLQNLVGFLPLKQI
jgi:hypothetical protein